MKPELPILHIPVRCSKSNDKDARMATTELKEVAPADFSHNQG